MVVKTIKKLSLAVILVGAMNAAYATGAGGYFGLMVGQTNLHVQNQTIQTSPTGGSQSLKPEGGGIGPRLYAGYGMNQYAAIEGGFTYYAATSYKTSITSNTLKTHAANFDLLGKAMLPISDTGFGVFAKLGGAYFFAKTTGKVANFSIEQQKDSVFRPEYAIGGSYDMTQNWVVDLTYSVIQYSSSKVKNPSYLALGISYHLLDPKCGQFLC